MKAAFRAEAIGLGPLAGGWSSHAAPGHKADRRQPWVAEITGTSARFGLAREFVPRKRDYRHASASGERGVSTWWTLESGRLYEARYRVTWDKWVTRYLTVTDEGEITDLAEAEAMAWASSISAATS